MNTLMPSANSSVKSLAPQVVNKALAHVKTIEKALGLDSRFKIRHFIRLRGETFVQGILQLWLIDLMDFFYGNNPAKKLTESQIITTAEMICDTYGFSSVNMADIKIIFERVKKGSFGKSYGALNPPQILEWISQYLNERQELAASINYQKSKRIFVPPTPRTSDGLSNKEIMKKLELKYTLDQVAKTQAKIKAKGKKKRSK